MAVSKRCKLIGPSEQIKQFLQVLGLFRDSVYPAKHRSQKYWDKFMELVDIEMDDDAKKPDAEMPQTATANAWREINNARGIPRFDWRTPASSSLSFELVDFHTRHVPARDKLAIVACFFPDLTFKIYECNDIHPNEAIVGTISATEFEMEEVIDEPVEESM
jgi:hypothetical protein